MNNQQITLVQESFEKVRVMSNTAAALFYDYLFLLDPTLRHMFKREISDQGVMLMSVLSSAVKGLSRQETLVPVLKNLGRRHVRYGVQDIHYDTVGAALMLALETGLGSEFTDEMREAWQAAYNLIADMMKEGANEDVPMAA
jgi:hemoglobin-like flavoprotein